jgi:hypothetical protein
VIVQTRIEKARPDDVDNVFRLLDQNHLPLEGLRDHLATVLAAERSFPTFGFEAIARADVPATVQASLEFISACPSGAVVMHKRL